MQMKMLTKNSGRMNRSRVCRRTSWPLSSKVSPRLPKGHDGRQQYGEGRARGTSVALDIENEPSDGARSTPLPTTSVDIEPKNCSTQDEGRDKKIAMKGR